MTPRPVAALAFVLCLSAATAHADSPVAGPWKYGVLTTLNLAQSSFSSNWKGGDKGSIVWVLGADCTAERQITPHYNLQNTLHAAYGQTTRQVSDPAEPRRYVWDSPDKTTDVLSFESNSRWSFNTWVDPYLSLGAETQFSDESSPAGAIRFNPVKFKETAGLARVLKKTAEAEVITRVGFGFRETMARAWLDPAAGTQRSFTTEDGGFEWQTAVTQPVLDKKVVYRAKLLVFQPVFFSKSRDLEAVDKLVVDFVEGAGGRRESVADYWRVPDVDWQNTFSAQITKYLAVNLYAEFMYDKFDAAANIDPSLPPASSLVELERNTRKAGQFKQTLTLALTYRLF